MNSEKLASPPHILIFSPPAQGHVNAMLKLAEVLCLSGLTQITFLNYDYIHEKLVGSSDIESRFASEYPGFKFKSIPYCMDGGPTDPAEWLRAFLDAGELKSKPIFKQMLLESNPPIDFIITNMSIGFMYDAATEVGIPCIQFHAISACSIWVFYNTPRIVAANQLPIRGEDDMDRLITAVPGMETVLRCRDLPKKLCQAKDIADPYLHIIANQMREAESVMLNTFEELEEPVLSQIQTLYPKTYAIGPIHELYKAKLKSANKQESSGSNGVWKADRSCIDWLDKQPLRSVLYVSFGSIALMTIDQIMEFWHGLENSKQRFLWVMRSNSIVDENGNVVEKVPVELEVGAKERGYVVSWAPQEEVLAHEAVGGFLTHSGWNSTLESIIAGVPMICWPYYADQQVNSRFISEVWKLGLDMKDICDRVIVEKMVNELMVNRRDEFAEAAAKMAEMARKSVAKDGSSTRNLERLIKEIKSKTIKN